MLDGFTGTDIAVYGIVGTLLPLIVSIINRPHFPAWAKQLVMVVVAVAGGLVAYAAKNHLDFSNTSAILATLIGVVGAAQVAYLVLWSRGAAPAIERNLNGGSSAVDSDAEPVDEDYDTPTADGAEYGPADEPQPGHAA